MVRSRGATVLAGRLLKVPSGVSNAGHGEFQPACRTAFSQNASFALSRGTSNLSSVLPALLKASQGPGRRHGYANSKSDSARHADISEEALMVCLRAVPGLMAFDGPVMFLDLRGA